MKVLLAAINAKYIHSNLGIYSLKTYGEKMLKEWGLAEQAEISLAEYTINHQMEQILQDIYKRKPDVIGFSCYIWNISYVKVILADIKKVLPDVKIWAGGPEVSYHGEAFLKEEPIVNVRMVNYKFSVLGEVGKPNTFTVANEKVNVFEALAMAGDMTVYGLRDNVRLIREDADGHQHIITLDMNRADIVQSPYYYLQQNDILYVTPNKTKAKTADISTSTTIWFSVVGTLVSLASLIITIAK